jgi:hypothetical protein
MNNGTYVAIFYDFPNTLATGITYIEKLFFKEVVHFKPMLSLDTLQK